MTRADAASRNRCWLPSSAAACPAAFLHRWSVRLAARLVRRIITSNRYSKRLIFYLESIFFPLSPCFLPTISVPHLLAARRAFRADRRAGRKAVLVIYIPYIYMNCHYRHFYAARSLAGKRGLLAWRAVTRLFFFRSRQEQTVPEREARGARISANLPPRIERVNNWLEC